MGRIDGIRRINDIRRIDGPGDRHVRHQRGQTASVGKDDRWGIVEQVLTVIGLNVPVT